MVDPDDSQLADECTQVAAAAERAAAWIMDNDDKVGVKSNALFRQFRRSAELARKERRATERPLSIGIFGQSQSGKSYLVSALAKKQGQPLIAVLDRERDFLKEIGPEKKQEATGLVTRFSIHPTGAPASHPVAVRVLNQVDLVKILANSYFSDFRAAEEQKRAPSSDEVSEAISAARARAQNTPADKDLREIDIDNLADYCNSQFSARKTIQVLDEDRYWVQLEELAPRLRIEDRAALYSFLWGRVPELTAFYVDLYRALSDLGFAEKVYCTIDALDPRDQSILDVDTLKQIADPSNSIDVMGEGGRRARLSRPHLAAIVAELLIQIKDRPWDYFQHTDILDFPGARSRKQHEDPEGLVKQPDGMSDLFLRGKVAYLFDRYCEDGELASLLLCQPPGPPEVQSLPGMIRTWIHKSQGSSAAARAKKDTALFFVMTKFDARFDVTVGAKDKTLEEIKEVWNAAIKTALTDFYGKGSTAWPDQWHPSQPFDNCFWLRSPDFQAFNLFKYDDSGAEIGLRDPDWLGRYQEAYRASELVRRHIRDPEQAWDEVLKSDGGAVYLANALSPVCKPELKRNQISARLNDLRHNMLQQLEEFCASDDREAEILKREAAAKQAVESLGAVVDWGRFGHLIREFQIDANALHSLFQRTRAGKPSIGPFRRVDGNSSAAAARNDRYTDFAATALSQWADQLETIPNQSEKLGFLQVHPETIEIVVRELLAGSDRIGLTKQIAECIDDTIPEIDEKLKPAMAAAERINRYVWKLGQDDLSLSDRATDGGGPVFQPRESTESIESLSKEYGKPYLQPFIVSWLESFIHLAKENARGKSTSVFSSEQNERLREIIQQLGA